MAITRKQIQEYRSLPKGYYHLCTEGWREGLLFNDKNQYAFGMCTIALLNVKFGVQIITFELMPNHIHLLLSGTGSQCVDCFYYIFSRINIKLKKDGYPKLPEDYGFKLIPAKDNLTLKKVIVYIARNRYEKGLCTPTGSLWGSSYLYFNMATSFIRGTKVKDISTRNYKEIMGTHLQLPPEWEIHPELGVLPSCYVRMDKVSRLFPSVKDYVTALVKDYESYSNIAKQLDEELEWSDSEIIDIIKQQIQQDYPGEELPSLTKDKKGRLAVQLISKYNIRADALSPLLGLPEYIITQFLNSKDYGIPHLRTK